VSVFLEGGLRFLMNMIVIFIFGCTAYIRHLVFIFKKIHFYFITDLFSLIEPSLQIRSNGLGGFLCDSVGGSKMSLQE